MAISNLSLNVRANTSRALADFNKFSRSLDNKFLISGLKLDVIRSALNTINRDFQRAIGEQGLASAGSLRAAQNQAALLTQTFKGFASESALEITTQIGTALNRVAVTAGGTMKDVQRTLAATPFISTNLSEDLRKQLSIGIMSAQRDLRRAGLGDNFGGIAQQFLMGRATGLQLVETGGAIESFLGAEIIKRAGGEGRIYSPEMRSEILAKIVNDPEIQEQLKLMARRAAGFRIVLEDLNTQLFNTESGVFGALRKVIDRTGKSTTMFDEVNELVDSIFGPDGMFRSIFKSIKEVFGIGDPMLPLITAVQFIKGMVDEFTEFFSGPVFKDILKFSKEALSRVGDLFKEIYETVRGSDFSSYGIRDSIVQIGMSLREYIREFGEFIRGQDVSDESGVVGGIAETLLEEVGKTAVTVIKELFSTLVNKVPEIATQVLPALNEGINNILTEAFGEIGGKIAKLVLSFVPGPVGAIARASTAGDLTGGGGNTGSMLAMGGAALLGTGALGIVGKLGFGAAKLGRGLFGPEEARMGLLKKVGGIEEIYNKRARDLYMPGAQRAPLSGFLSRFISPRENRPRTLAEAGIGLPETARGRELREKREALMRGRITAQTSMFAKDIQSTPPGGGGGGSGRPPGGGGGGGSGSPFGSGVFRRNFSTGLDSAKIPRFGSTSFSYTGLPPDFRGNFSTGLGGAKIPRFESTSVSYTGLPPDFGRYAHEGNRLGYSAAYSDEYVFADFNSKQRKKQLELEIQEHEEQRKIRDFSLFEESVRENKEWRKRSDVRKRFIQAKGGGLKGRMALAGAQWKRTGWGKKGMIMAGLGLAGLGIGGILAAPQGKAQTLDPDTGQMVPVAGGGSVAGANAAETDMPKPTAAESVGAVLSGGFEGASLGASIGSIIPGVGTAAGAVIGGIIGGVAPLMDEGVKKSVGELISGLRASFTSAWNNFAKWINESISWAVEKLEEAFKIAVNGIIDALNVAISAFAAIPRNLVGSIEGLVKSLPLPGKEATLSVLGSLKNFYSMQIPNFYKGKDYYGPAMAKEAMMSGRKPMVVNDGEFVIPRDGFPILAGLVGQNLRSTGVINQGESRPVMINISLSVTANSIVANAEELADTLRDPVYQIINDAWTEAYNSDNVLRTRV